MGSSILASLSEAGGNDPYRPASGPLPPHLPDDADRVGTRPTQCPLQSSAQTSYSACPNAVSFLTTYAFAVRTGIHREPRNSSIRELDPSLDALLGRRHPQLLALDFRFTSRLARLLLLAHNMSEQLIS